MFIPLGVPINCSACDIRTSGAQQSRRNRNVLKICTPGSNLPHTRIDGGNCVKSILSLYARTACTKGTEKEQNINNSNIANAKGDTNKCECYLAKQVEFHVNCWCCKRVSPGVSSGVAQGAERCVSSTRASGGMLIEQRNTGCYLVERCEATLRSTGPRALLTVNRTGTGQGQDTEHGWDVDKMWMDVTSICSAHTVDGI